MKNRLFLASLAMAVAIPVMVAPVQAEGMQEVKQEVSKEFVGFIDVTKESYAYDAIMYLASEGIVAGYGNGYYGLKDDVTRGQVSALIVRYLKLDTSKDFENPYTDVTGDRFEDSVLAVTDAGYMSGKGNGKFEPKATLTRAEMAVVLTNVFDLKVKADYVFHDMPENHWANTAVKALYSNGLTFGAGDYKYNPGQNVSRGQYAEFLYRGINLDTDFEAEPMPEPPKPEVKPDPKPEPPKPEVKPDPEPEKGDNYIPSEEEVVKPEGWTKEKLEKHKEQAFEAAKNRPNRYGPYGISRVGLETVRSSFYLSTIPTVLKNIKSSDTYDDWIRGLNYTLETGEAYSAPDNSYTLYAEYYTSMDPWTEEPIEKVAIHFGA